MTVRTVHWVQPGLGGDTRIPLVRAWSPGACCNLVTESRFPPAEALVSELKKGSHVHSATTDTVASRHSRFTRRTPAPRTGDSTLPASAGVKSLIPHPFSLWPLTTRSGFVITLAEAWDLVQKRAP